MRFNVIGVRVRYTHGVLKSAGVAHASCANSATMTIAVCDRGTACGFAFGKRPHWCLFKDFEISCGRLRNVVCKQSRALTNEQHV
jgi:hypothetical protein